MPRALVWAMPGTSALLRAHSADGVEDGIMEMICVLFRTIGSLINPPVSSLSTSDCTESVRFPVPFGHTPLP